jgi:hypothetical protein
MQNDIQQRPVDFDAAVVGNKAQPAKFVHEEADAGPGRSNHLRKRLLADFRNYRLRFLLVKGRPKPLSRTTSFILNSCQRRRRVSREPFEHVGNPAAIALASAK